MLDKKDIKKLRNDLDILKETSYRGVELRKESYDHYKSNRKAEYTIELKMGYSYRNAGTTTIYDQLNWANKVRETIEKYIEESEFDLAVSYLYIEGRKITLSLMDIIEYTKQQLIS